MTISFGVSCFTQADGVLVSTETICEQFQGRSYFPCTWSNQYGYDKIIDGNNFSRVSMYVV